MALNKTKLKMGTALTAILMAGQIYSASYSTFVVSGNNRIEDSVVLGVAGLTPGQSYNDDEINAALQRLYASGLFGDVSIAPQGSIVVINVVENATINSVYFEGNQKYKDEVLAQVVRIGSRQGLDRARIEEEAQNIRRFYAARSRFDAEVRPVIISAGNGLYNVVFEIDEGTTSQVERISFTGNAAVSDWRLRRTVESGETGLFSTFFSRDDFASERLVSDEAKLKNYYRENGYYNADVRAVAADYNAGGDFYLSYAIQEGRQYNFGKIDVTSQIPGVSAQRYANLVEARSGRLYKASKIRETLDAIEIQAAQDGLPFLRAEPEVTPNESNGTLDVTIKLVQADRSYVERIDIHGNESTIDRVIRRQFEVVEGDPLNARKVQEARKRIEALRFFSRVDVSAREGSEPDKKIIDVEVEEMATGSMSFGGGYSNSNGYSVSASITERNFMGRGQTVSARVDWGEKSQTFNLSFEEPGIFERDLAGGFRLYYNDADRTESSFETTNIGFEPFVRFPTSDNSRLSLGYFARSNEIRDVKDTASPLIKAEEGTIVTSGLSANWVWDRLNAGRNPTRGWIMRLGGKYAGLGGDAQWYQLAGKAKFYYPLFSEDVIFTLEAEGGVIETLNDHPIRVTERYFMGGDKLFGFASGGIGPRDKTDDINSALGGNYYAALRGELTFPLGLPEDLGVRGGLFWNAGSVWGLDRTEGGASGAIDDDMYMRAAYGASILWDLGGQNLRFSWSNPYLTQDYDELQEFSVSVSTRF